MDEPKTRPPVWQLVRDAARELGSAGQQMTYAAIKQHVWARFPDVNPSTLACQIIICTVNQPSRVHYPENKKPRLANGNYDFLFTVGRGLVVLYDQEKHGQWEIIPKGTGLTVHLLSEPVDEATEQATESAQGGTFALEAHLRDYLARNLPTLDAGATPLKLYTSEDGRGGVEFQTDVGPIDILAVSPSGNYYVFELKLGRGADAALGQILRYMGWVQQHLCGAERKVQGIVVASDVGQKLRYAATQVPNVRLMEYELSVALKPCQLAIA